MDWGVVMNDYITISELSKLMNVSVHQIRYFEEKGVLYPAYTDTNQYRMYGIPEIYQLSQILLLRKLNIPVQQIKESVMSYSADDYKQLLEKSLQNIDAEIEQLITLKHFIQRTLEEHNETRSNPDPIYQVKYFDTRQLKRWIEFSEEEQINARNLYDKKVQLPNLFESDLHYLYEGDQVTMCFEAAMDSSDIILEKGNYLIKSFQVTEDHDIFEEIKKLQTYLYQHQYASIGQIVIIEKSYLSMFSNHSLLYEIQVKISEVKA